MNERQHPNRSLGALATFAMRHTNAAGYALYALDFSGALVRRASCGVGIPRAEAVKDLLALCADAGVEPFLLQSGEKVIGVLAVKLSSNGTKPVSRQLWGRTARIIEALLNLFQARDVQVELAARVGELEADLVDQKIADRVGGLLEGSNPDGDAIDVIERHVQKILGARHLTQILDELRSELEDQTSERALVAQAKALLQNRNALSEQQAYIRLRAASRRTRKRMVEVAREIIEDLEYKTI